MNRRWADPVEGTDPPDGPLRSRARPGLLRPTSEPGPAARRAVRSRRVPSPPASSLPASSLPASSLPGADPRAVPGDRPTPARPVEHISGAECCTAARPPSER